MAAQSAVIVSAVRTPIGRLLGALSSVSATDLGAIAVKEAVNRAGIDPKEVTEVSTQRAMILALLISNLAGVIVSVLGTLSDVMSAVGWSAVAIYVVFGLGYGYFQFVKTSDR